MPEFIIWSALILGGFLFGSVMFAEIIPKHFCHVDVCEVSPDKNPGAANVFSACGVGIGLLVLALDMLKGFLPVFAACRYKETDSLLFAVVMTAPVLGHAIGLFNRLRGGKCIATIFGVEIALLWITRTVIILAGLYILFSTLIKINPNRVRSIVTFALFGILAAGISTLRGQYSVALGSAVISAIAVIKHLRIFSEAPEKEKYKMS